MLRHIRRGVASAAQKAQLTPGQGSLWSAPLPKRYELLFLVSNERNPNLSSGSRSDIFGNGSCSASQGIMEGIQPDSLRFLCCNSGQILA